jgi:ketosteroid isomerase-like protein
MAEEDVDIARRLVDAWNRRDVDAAPEICAEDVIWESTMTAGVVYRGLPAVLEASQALWRTWQVLTFDESEVTGVGDSVLWLGTVHAEGRGSTLQLDLEYALVVEIRDGDVARVRMFPSWADGRAAAGSGS